MKGVCLVILRSILAIPGKVAALGCSGTSGRLHSWSMAVPSHPHTYLAVQCLVFGFPNLTHKS